jgi:hypothetical protein
VARPLARENHERRQHDLLEGLNVLRWLARSGAPMPHVAQSREASRGLEVHLAVDTLAQLPALEVTPANAQERAQVEQLARAMGGC